MKKLLALAAAAIFCIGAGIEFILPKEDTFALNTETDHFYWSPSEEALDAATLWSLSKGVDRSLAECKTDNWVPPRYESGLRWGTGPLMWPFISTDAKYQLDSDVVGLSHDLTKYHREPQANADYGTDKKAHNEDEWLDQNTVLLARVSSTGNTSARIEYGQKLEFTNQGSDFYICAPGEGTIETSHFACDFGSELLYRFNAGTYDAPVWVNMSIKGAKCWYCCRDKNPEDSNSGVHVDPDTGALRYTANSKDSLKGREMHTGDLLVVATKNTTVTFSLVS